MNTQTRIRLLQHIPHTHDVRQVLHSFTGIGRVLVSILLVTFLASTVWVLAELNAALSTQVPVSGGKITEGILGTPRFVNPVLALSNADQDLSALVFAGLLNRQPDGTYTPELAESYTRNNTGTEYTVTIREDAVFHDGTPVTADDVLFTISLIQNPTVQSPHRPQWEGVSVTKESEKRVTFTLAEDAHTNFLDNLTVGILPKHLWEHITPDQITYSDLNIEAVGAGPFEVDKIRQKKRGIIESYTLESFSDYALSKPYLDEIELRFYPNKNDLYQAFNRGAIDRMNSTDPEIAYILKQQGVRIETALLPRVFGLFFNQDESPIFTDRAAREAIAQAINRKKIVTDVLFGYGTTTTSPIPPQLLTPPPLESNEKEVHTILRDGGWQRDTDSGVWQKEISDEMRSLRFSIATGDSPDLIRAVTQIKQQLASVGIPVEVSVYEIGDLNQNKIRPRSYEALFFGQVIRNMNDLYDFWHSSQRDDPGLNIARYTNAAADKLLDQAREENDPVARKKLYQSFAELVITDLPAVFVYTPAFIYAIGDDAQNISLEEINTPSDRFNSVHMWYTQTDFQWNFLSNS